MENFSLARKETWTDDAYLRALALVHNLKESGHFRLTRVAVPDPDNRWVDSDDLSISFYHLPVLEREAAEHPSEVLEQVISDLKELKKLLEGD